MITKLWSFSRITWSQFSSQLLCFLCSLQWGRILSVPGEDVMTVWKKGIFKIEFTSFQGDHSIQGYPLLRRRSKPVIEVSLKIGRKFWRKVEERWLPVWIGREQGTWSYPTPPKTQMWKWTLAMPFNFAIMFEGWSQKIIMTGNRMSWSPHKRHPWQDELRPKCMQGDPQGCFHSPWKINLFYRTVLCG